MDNVEIYEAVLVTFNKAGEKKISEIRDKSLSTQVLEFTIVRTIDCVIDFERGKAIDLATNKIYHIINRNSNGIIISGECEKILQEKLVVNIYYKKWMQDMSLMYKLFLTQRAKAVYNKYLENLNNTKKSQKVKKIGKMERK